MRAIILIALREYAENAKTKGFWIGLFLFPIIIFASIFVQKALEESTPTRHFVLVDQSGLYGPAIREDIASSYRGDVLRALGEYAQEFALNPVVKIPDLEKVPGDKLDGMMKKVESVMGPEMDGMFTDEGFEKLLAEMSVATDGLIEERPPFEMPQARFQEVPLPIEMDADLTADELAKLLRPYLRGEKTVAFEDENVDLFAAVLLPRDIQESVDRPGLAGLIKIATDSEAASNAEAAGEVVSRKGGQFWAANLADSDLKSRIQSSINDELRHSELVIRGLDADAVAVVNGTSLHLSSLDPKKDEGKEEVSMADKIRQWAPVGFVYLLWIGIFTISQMLLNNTVEEKSNRIIEVLLSSVTAGELMLGKLAGIAGIGITMIGVWMGSLITILKVSSGPEAEIPNLLLDVLMGSGLLYWFVLYFCLGYLLYAGIFLAIGSLCNTIKDAQNMMGPVMIVMMVPLITMMFIPKDPNGTLATILSWIPLYTPFTMMNRAAADPPMFDKIGTLVLLICFTVFTLFMVGRIFRAGILRTGQPPKFKELLSWMKS
ncbi:MAG: ABC transporter permease [Planctomycetota bacterium]|nr:ABC transporter permease [Planctomycetota bacterium]